MLETAPPPHSCSLSFTESNVEVPSPSKKKKSSECNFPQALRKAYSPKQKSPLPIPTFNTYTVGCSLKLQYCWCHKVLIFLFPSDYRVVGKMGEGTFSEVLRCQSHVDGKLYACKRMKQKYDRYTLIKAVELDCVNGGNYFVFTVLNKWMDYERSRLCVDSTHTLTSWNSKMWYCEWGSVVWNVLWACTYSDAIITILCCYSDRRSGTLSLICELMDMNIYELIKGTYMQWVGSPYRKCNKVWQGCNKAVVTTL